MRAHVRPGTALALALSIGGAPGCYCSHELEADDAAIGDDAAREDAGGIADAALPDAARDGGPPTGAVWIPVDAAVFEVAYERCETREGQTLVLRVRVVTDRCDEPGNVRWSVDRMAREIRVRPFVWRPTGVPACPPTTREIIRDVALRGAGLSAGVWAVVAPDGSRLAIVVGPRLPELTCTDCREDGESCAVDEECAGLRECAPVRGDGACTARCASSCQPFSETDGEYETDIGCSHRLGPAQCREDPDLGWTCALTTSTCTACPEGMACAAPAACEWTTTAWPEPCRADGDCPSGRSCVLLPESTAPTCMIRCRGDHPCPLGEACGRDDVVCPHPKI